MDNPDPTPDAITALQHTLDARIESLAKLGTGICPAYVYDALRMISCGVCGYSAETHLLRDCRQALASLSAQLAQRDAAYRLGYEAGEVFTRSMLLRLEALEAPVRPQDDPEPT